MVIGKGGMMERGYQPNKGNLDTSNPPKGGSGVPLKTNKEKGGMMEVFEYLFGRFNLKKQIEEMNENRCMGCKRKFTPDSIFKYKGRFLCPKCLERRKI